MIISAIMKNEKQKGDHLLQVSKDEAQLIQAVFTTFCDEHKRQKKAKAMLKEFDDNLQVW